MRENVAAPGAAKRLHVAFDVQRFARGGEMFGHVVQFHPEAQVGLVRTVAADGVLVFHAAERALHRDAGHGAGAHHHVFDHAENGVLRGERNFQVQLREFGLAVGAQVFVAKTFDDLEVAVHPADHQDLLENLRRLRQRVKLPGMHAAGHQIIARALGRRAREHGRFDFIKAHLVHGLADFEDHAVAQREVLPRLRAPQVEIAVTQARLFVRGQVVFDHERRRLRRVQDAQFAGDDFHFARSEIGIRLLPLHHAPDHGDDKFRAQFLGARMRGGVQLLVEDNLREARAVAQINEDQDCRGRAACGPSPSGRRLCRRPRRADCRSSVCVAVFRVNRARVVFPSIFLVAQTSVCGVWCLQGLKPTG